MIEPELNKAQSAYECREQADGIVRRTVEYHVTKLHAWRWLERAMRDSPPMEEEEKALYSMLSICSRERY